MQWLIQCTDLPDNQTTKLLEVIKAKALPFIGLGVIPFTHEIKGLELGDPNIPSMFYGSVQISHEISKWSTFRPGVYYEKSWWDSRNWIGKRSDLLNEDQINITAEELRANWVSEPIFVKSVEDKWLTGMVIEPVKEDRDNWLIEQSQLDGDAILVMSTAKNIETECRFFVVNGEIVTGSTYRWLGVRFTTRPIDQEMWDFAREAVKKWMPCSTIVIDICRLRNGEYKIVEFNCINSSGFYNCEVERIVEAMEIMVKEVHTISSNEEDNM